MSALAFSHRYSGLALLLALARPDGGLPLSAAVLDADSARLLRRLPELHRLETAVAGDPAADRLIRCASVTYSFFGPPSYGRASDTPRVDVHAAGDGVERAADPLPWALAAGLRSVTLTLGRVVAGGTAGLGCAHLVPLPEGITLREAAEAAAGVLAPCLGPSCGSPVGSSGETDKADATPARLELPARLNWAAPADRVARLVRAFSPPAPGAWTTWRDMQLFVNMAAVATHPPLPLLPGTVIETLPTGLLVAAGDGAVQLAEIRDVIGKVDPARIAPGDVLGGDSAADVAGLAQRIQDLESVVRRLAEGVDFL